MNDKQEIITADEASWRSLQQINDTEAKLLLERSDDLEAQDFVRALAATARGYWRVRQKKAPR